MYSAYHGKTRQVTGSQACPKASRTQARAKARPVPSFDPRLFVVGVLSLMAALFGAFQTF